MTKIKPETLIKNIQKGQTEYKDAPLEMLNRRERRAKERGDARILVQFPMVNMKKRRT